MMHVWVLLRKGFTDTCVDCVASTIEQAKVIADEVAEEPLTWKHEGDIYDWVSNRTRRLERYYLTGCPVEGK